MKENKEITLEEYELTNINLDGYYVVKLKDGTISKIYPNKQEKTDYIEKDGKRIRLSKEVRNVVLASIREYERYGI